MFPILGCDLKWKNLEHKTPRNLAKEGGFKGASKEIRRSKSLINWPGQGSKNPNPRLFLRLHDWSTEHARLSFGSLLVCGQGWWDSPPQGEDLCWPWRRGKILWTQSSWLLSRKCTKKSGGGGVDVPEFFKGTRYLSKSYVLGPLGLRRRKRGWPKSQNGQVCLPLPICIIPSPRVSHARDGGPPITWSKPTRM